MVASGDLEVLRRALAAIGDELVLHSLTFVERAQAGALHGRDVDEHVFVSGRWPDEPIAFGRVEPFDGAFLHGRSPGVSKSKMTPTCIAALRATSRIWEVPKKRAPLGTQSGAAKNRLRPQKNIGNAANARPNNCEIFAN